MMRRGEDMDNKKKRRVYNVHLLYMYICVMYIHTCIITVHMFIIYDNRKTIMYFFVKIYINETHIHAT